MAACGCPLAAVSATHSPRPKPVTLRHEQGRSHLASLLNYWLRKADLSHEQLSRIADWGLGEAGCISPSQISHLRNRNVARGASARNLDGLAGANRALWLWQEKGEDRAIRLLGPYHSWRVEPEWLDRGYWLPAEDDPVQPLEFADFALIDAGHLKLDYLGGQLLSPTESMVVSIKLTDLLNSLGGSGSAMEQIQRVQAAYPLTDPTRRERLRDLMLGGQWSREELEQELYALAILVATLRGVPPASYGPAELHAELAAHRRRT